MRGGLFLCCVICFAKPVLRPCIATDRNWPVTLVSEATGCSHTCAAKTNFNPVKLLMNCHLCSVCLNRIRSFTLKCQAFLSVSTYFCFVLFRSRIRFFSFLLPFRVLVGCKYWSLSWLLSTGSSFETNSHHRPIHFNNSGQSVESVNDGFSSYLVSLPSTALRQMLLVWHHKLQR